MGMEGAGLVGAGVGLPAGRQAVCTCSRAVRGVVSGRGWEETWVWGLPSTAPLWGMPVGGEGGGSGKGCRGVRGAEKKRDCGQAGPSKCNVGSRAMN